MNRDHSVTVDHGEPHLFYLRHDGIGMPELVIVTKDDPSTCNTYHIGMKRLRLLLAQIAQYNIKDIPNGV